MDLRTPRLRAPPSQHRGHGALNKQAIYTLIYER